MMILLLCPPEAHQAGGRGAPAGPLRGGPSTVIAVAITNLIETIAYYYYHY